ncbi:MAG: tetratricopeptide repeat protein [Candidatus Omnitrophica bacterium]|nr:tetratricopeptide repeat protein [Candidatus Omnitrophota bacterium]
MIDIIIYLRENYNMKKFYIFIAFFLLISSTYSYWEWTPQTKKWINPKYAVKDTPQEQFNYAEEFRKNGKIDIAIREHKKLLKHYPKSEYAPNSCFILGEIYKEKGEKKKAFDYFQKIINEYPSSPLVFSAIKIQSEIAEKSLNERDKGFFRFIVKKEEKGDLMNKVIESSPYDAEAIDRMFKLADFYYQIKEYEKGIEILDKIIKNFPEKKDVHEEVKYLKIKYLLSSIPEKNYDTDVIEEIKDQILEFSIDYPKSRFKDEIEKIEKVLDEKEAEKYYQIANYYERAGKKKSAIYYYKKIVDKFPNTEYGKIANEKINKGL